MLPYWPVKDDFFVINGTFPVIRAEHDENTTQLLCPASSFLHMSYTANTTSLPDVSSRVHTFLVDSHLLPQLLTLCEHRESCILNTGDWHSETDNMGQVDVEVQPTCTLILPKGKSKIRI